MKLKRVKIVGFKTFADKTEFELDGDIVAVVGPNGCGKSNIVDAVLWGLGETSARAIRAQSGKEVIFAGSAHRKPHGFAEVTLHFDNEDGSLPIDTPEVSVTRRVDRGGQGDYEINRRRCRLKDVADLLSDSGLGRAGYAIVGQSDIDQALAASPQQRRAWIDEVAGVHRYRLRRQESVRRLDAAQLHLQRVHDVLRELDAQREPLAAEAEVAMRHRSALKSLRQVECGLLVKELAAVVDELDKLEIDFTQTLSLHEKESQQANQAEAVAKAKSEEGMKLENSIEELRGQLGRAKALLDQAESAWQIASTRLEGLDELESNLFAETGAATERVSQARIDLETATQDHKATSEAYDAMKEELAGVGDEAKQLKRELEDAERKLVKARNTLADKNRAELERLHRDQRSTDIGKEIRGIDDALPELLTGIAEAEQALQGVQSLAEGKQASLAEYEAQVRDHHKSVDTAAVETRRILAEIAIQDGRRRGILATIEAHEGLSQGSRAVLGLVKSGELRGTYTPVGDSIDVDSDLALAIDTGLGASANDLIVPDEEHAKRAIALLKESSLGRATFQPISLMRPIHVNADLMKVLNERGVIGLANELVSCDDSCRPVIDSLLGHVLVVESLDDALRLARTAGWKRCVTLDGEVVHSSGAVTGGKANRQASGLVQRQAELNEATQNLEQLSKDLKKAEEAAVGKVDAIAGLEKEAVTLRAELEPLVAEVDEAKSWLSNLRNELGNAERSRNRLASELESLREAIPAEALDVDLEAAEAERDDIWKRLTARSTDAETASARLTEAKEHAANARRRLEEAQRRLSLLDQSDKQRENRVSNLEPERKKHRQAIAVADGERNVHRAEIEGLETQLATLSQSRREVLAEAHSLTEQAQTARRTAGDAEARAHQIEIKKTRLEAKRAVGLERLLDEYGVNEASALEQAPTTVVPPDAASLVSRLRREIKEMGDVNLGAIEAFERLSERFDELQGQSMDIEDGISEIQTSMVELDRLTKEKFGEAFALVRDAFAETFKRVFGGGEGLLQLVSGADELENGVDIQVTIPGKKRQRLELLSGGERALSALAFLFALLRVKPSPLVILDEVDAPLDGRNVERFIGLMRDFAEDTQFILVTHNPMTIESADVWFGVTMQEPGVSTLVPFKVADKTAVKAVVPDVYLKG